MAVCTSSPMHSDVPSTVVDRWSPTKTTPTPPIPAAPWVREPVLPVARLVRLGASVETVAVLTVWFGDLSANGRKAAALQLALRSDQGLSEYLEALNAIPSAASANVLAWVNLQGSKTAVQLALLFEQRRETPRVTLLNKLQAMP